MVFTAPSWSPELGEIPDVSIFDFLFDEKYGRASLDSSLPAYICGVSGTVISAREQKERVHRLAKGLALELGWEVNKGSELDKVVAIFAQNTIDVPALTLAVHRLNGVCAPINASFTEWEVAHQVKKSKAKVLFTVAPLLEVARKAAKLAGISEDKIYLCDMYEPNEAQQYPAFTRISALFAPGDSAPELEDMHWTPGQSAKQIAFLSHSSGTSGPPKLVMISHQCIIANVIQTTLLEQAGRGGPNAREVALGMLPQSHAYSVVVIIHLGLYQGDTVVVFPKFDMQTMLSSVPKYKINILNIVPPIILAMGKNLDLLKKYDLSSVKWILTGGAPLTKAVVDRLHEGYPEWTVRQAYGMTEVGCICCHTSAEDPWAGSSGSPAPGTEVKLVANDGREITECDQIGEVWTRTPSLALGYFGDEAATKETFVEAKDGRWLRTGDIGCFKRSPHGNNHIFISDRIKELIKVKANQVVPAELEDMLLTHPAVAECAVIGVVDVDRGEAPRAYVQRAASALQQPEDDLRKELFKLVETRAARFKWLRGGIVFIDLVPKSPSGKTLRRELRQLAEAEDLKKTRSKI